MDKNEECSIKNRKTIDSFMRLASCLIHSYPHPLIKRFPFCTRPTSSHQ